MSISISGNGSFTGANSDYSFDQSVGIAGTLTYEDVTNIDSVGVITARSGINVGPSAGIGITLNVDGSAVFSDRVNGMRNDNTLYDPASTGTGALPCFYSRNVGAATTNSYASIGFSVGESGTARGTINLISESGDKASAFAFQQRTNANEGFETLRINSSGNVLIGNTLPSLPTISLNADGSATFAADITCNQNLLIRGGDANGVYIRNGADTAWNAHIQGNGLATFKNKLTVQVDSATPIDSADIYNGISGGDNRVKIRTFANGGGDPYLFFDGGGNNMVVGLSYAGTTSNELVMGTGNSASGVTGLRINGLGAATFNSTLQTGGRLYIQSTNGFIDYNNTASTLEFYTNNTQQGEFSPTAFMPATDNAKFLGAASRRWATVYAGNGTINTSDRNEKNSIQESDLGLSFIKKLKPVSYKWNNPNLNSKTHYGLIAQDVEETILSEGKTLDDFGCVDKPEDASMGINYNELIAPLIKAIQEQQEQIETLEAKVQALEGS